MRDIKLFTL